MFSFILEACHNFTEWGSSEEVQESLESQPMLCPQSLPKGGAWEVDGEAAPPVGLLSYKLQVGSFCLLWQFQFCAMIPCIPTIRDNNLPIIMR